MDLGSDKGNIVKRRALKGGIFQSEFSEIAIHDLRFSQMKSSQRESFCMEFIDFRLA